MSADAPSTATLMRPNGAATSEAAPAPLDAFRPLDVYAGGLADEAPRLDALATISAGDRGPTREGNKPGLPRRSTDGTIKLHDATGRAPGLRAALEQTQFKSLCIAFPWDDPALFIQQRFTRYSASALEVYGDHRELRVLEAGGQRTVPSGSVEYRRLLDTCAVSVSVYFMLAEWGHDGPAVVLPDGLGFYRLRFTSRNSLRSILNGLRAVGRFTGSRVAGVPFELGIDYREVADRTGQRRAVPVWVLVMRPPSTVRLSSQNWASVMQGALSQGAAFKQLPPPGEETVALAEWEGPEIDLDELDPLAAPTDAEIGEISAGGPLEADYWRRRWHGIARGSTYDDPENRAEFIAEFTDGQFASLKRFLEVASEGEAADLITALQIAVDDERAGADGAAESREATGFDPVPEGRGSAAGRIPSADDDDESSLADAAEATVVAPIPPSDRHGRAALNAFFAQLSSLKPRPTPADIHRVLGVASIQEVVDLDLALRALFEAWRREHPPAVVDLEHPAGSIEAEWQRYTAAQQAVTQWNRDYPEQAIRYADPPADATAAQVRAYAEGLERRLAKLAYVANGGGS